MDRATVIHSECPRSPCLELLYWMAPYSAYRIHGFTTCWPLQPALIPASPSNIVHTADPSPPPSLSQASRKGCQIIHIAPPPLSQASFKGCQLIHTAPSLPPSLPQASCKGCQLLVDGMVVIDVYEPLLSGAAVTKTSPCLSLVSSVVSTTK